MAGWFFFLRRNSRSEAPSCNPHAWFADESGERGSPLTGGEDLGEGGRLTKLVLTTALNLHKTTLVQRPPSPRPSPPGRGRNARCRPDDEDGLSGRMVFKKLPAPAPNSGRPAHRPLCPGDRTIVSSRSSQARGRTVQFMAGPQPVASARPNRPAFWVLPGRWRAPHPPMTDAVRWAAAFVPPFPVCADRRGRPRLDRCSGLVGPVFAPDSRNSQST